MEIFSRTFAILVIFSVIMRSEQKALVSPCRDVFTYDRDDNMQWFGKVKIPSDDVETVLKLFVVLSLKMPPSSDYEGHIELLHDPKIVYENILHGRLIQYKVVFPSKTAPALVSIAFNGRNYCNGLTPPKLETIIHLEHFRIFEDEEDEDTPETTRKPKPSNTTRKPSTQSTTRRTTTTLKPVENLISTTSKKPFLNPGKFHSKSKTPSPMVQFKEPEDNKAYTDDLQKQTTHAESSVDLQNDYEDQYQEEEKPYQEEENYYDTIGEEQYPAVLPSDVDIRRRINL